MSENRLEAVVKVGKIIFSKNSFYILSVLDINNGYRYTVKGDLINVSYDTDYKIVADYVEDKKYGGQYKIVLFTPYSELNDEKDAKRFLSYFISEITIDNLFSDLEDPIKTIKSGNIVELRSVKGVGEYTAKKIIDKYQENVVYAEAYAEFGKYNITAKMVKKIIEKYKSVSTAIVKLRENPYELTSIKGIGWSKADEIGVKMGFDLMSDKRLEAYIKYIMHEEAQKGNSWLTMKQLGSFIVTMYKNSKVGYKENKKEILSLTQTVIKDMYDRKILHWNDEKTFISISRYYDLELKVANELKRLLGFKSNTEDLYIENVVKEIQEDKGYELTDEQISAIKLACENNVVLITGASGVGKSTSVYGLLKAFPKCTFAQTALSGKASSNLKDITGSEGSTIHRLLGYQPPIGFKFNKEQKLHFDIVILDEVSMLGGELFLSLLEAMKDGSKLIMLGDFNQLPSIGTMNILKDIINSKFIPTQILTRIHRQAQRSAIITESFKVKDGRQITTSDFTGLETRGELLDFTLDIFDDKSKTPKRVIKHFEEEYERLQDINKIQIIVPMKKDGNLSAFNLNNTIQDIYNPLEVGVKYLKLKRYGKDFEFRVGDKVINRKNTYNIYNTEYIKTNIFNGYMGMIVDIDQKERTITIEFNYSDVGRVIIGGDQLQNIELAYCITCHSFQGSQCDTVIVGLDYSSYKLLTKEFVYTAMTRPKKYLILCAENSALRYAIAHSDTSIKQTFLTSMLNRDDLELVNSEHDEYDDGVSFENDNEDVSDNDLLF